MSDKGWPDGYNRLVLDETDSTNAHALRIASTVNLPTWILAHNQTAAHGRRGRPWVMDTNNFAATLLYRFDEAPDRVALRSFVMALALDEALVAVSGRFEPFALKWPNDVLLNGGKVAGILLESSINQQGQTELAIGVGVNLAVAPQPDQVEPQAVPPVSLAQEMGVRVPAVDFLEYLACAFSKYEARLKTYGFAPIRNAWLARAARLGATITARTGQVTYDGTFETIDEAGALVLKTPKGQISIPAADIYF